MDEKALKTLEFTKIKEMLKTHAISQMGKDKCDEIVPLFYMEEIVLSQKETTESVNYILKKGNLPLGGIKDIRNTLKRVSLGGTLSIEELLFVAEFLYVCKKITKYSNKEGREEVFETLDPLFEAVTTIPELEKEISRCIQNDKELFDDASSKLRDIRRNVKSANAKIKEQLNSVIHSNSYKNMLQDNVITMRGGRYCVPIKSEYRNAFSGMIHDQSSTGSTLFIEPSSVVDLNNKIRELGAEEKEEINKILVDLSFKVSLESLILEANLDVLTHLDFVFAKGQLSISHFGTEPIFNKKGYVNIKKARHPLLSKETVVPTDIYIGKDFTTLLITGPNTGGKTVSLKTLGLFTIMGQAGLHIPALEKSELAIFSNVFADIGDEQSIEQSLSTFSGHMTNIVKILDDVTYDSLVLFDELGAGTDPTEGAALAIAIVEYLRKKKIRVAVTTHYSELKVYALSTENVMNAACEFDVETLRPTYKLLIGIPGKSNAFAISKRLGLPDYIIESAKESLSLHAERFEDVITDLEISKKSVFIEQERAEQFRKEAERLKKTVENEKDKIADRKEKLLLKAQNEAREILESAKSEASSIIKEMQTIVSSSPSFKELEIQRQKIADKLNETKEATDKIKSENKDIKPIDRKLQKGDRVFVHSLGQSAVVLTNPDSSSNVTVQAGSMKIKVNISSLSLDESKPQKQTTTKSKYTVAMGNKSGGSVKNNKSMHISAEIDLRGMMVDEALAATDKYLDDACLSGLSQINIIHGKGTGALRQAVTDHLRRHPHIKSYRLGVYGEGDSGITVAELN